MRGNKVYDTFKHSTNIGTQLVANIVTLLSIEDLPAAAFSYLRRKAAVQQYIDEDGDAQKMQRLEMDMTRAWNKLMSEEFKNIGTNALDSPAAQKLTYRIGQYSGTSNPFVPGGRSYG